MDQLRRPGADSMHTQQLAILAMKEHLEEATVVAEDLASRNLSVSGHVRLIGDFPLGQLMFGRTDHRDLWDGVDTDRKVRSHRSGLDSECMAGGEAPLLRGCGRKAWIADHVARRKDMRHASPEGLVHSQPPALSSV